MFPKIDDINNNVLVEANFLSYRFTIESAQKYAQALSGNTSVQKLEFVNCRLSDELFAELVKGILSRKTPFIHINFDLNHLTPVSFPLLKEIIQNRKCQHLMFYGNVDPFDDETRLNSYKTQMNELITLADMSEPKVHLHYDDPRTRSYKGFFQILQEKRFNEIRKIQEETKEEPKHSPHNS